VVKKMRKLATDHRSCRFEAHGFILRNLVARDPAESPQPSRRKQRKERLYLRSQGVPERRLRCFWRTTGRASHHEPGEQNVSILRLFLAELRDQQASCQLTLLDVILVHCR
jgi:hypothetical protein